MHADTATDRSKFVIPGKANVSATRLVVERNQGCVSVMLDVHKEPSHCVVHRRTVSAPMTQSSSLSGPGPLVGPVLAAQFGYLPGTLWILIGVVLGGAVQDFIILFASIRRDGKSLGQMVKEELGSTAGAVAMIAIFAIMMILLAVLGLVGDQRDPTRDDAAGVSRAGVACRADGPRRRMAAARQHANAHAPG